MDTPEIPSAVLELEIAVELSEIPVDGPETPARVELGTAELLGTDTMLAAVPVETPETPTRTYELEDALEAGLDTAEVETPVEGPEIPSEVTSDVAAELRTLVEEALDTKTGAVPVDAPEIPSTVLWTELAAEELEAAEDEASETLV